MDDHNTRFLLTNRHLRGQLVQLGPAFKAVLETSTYPSNVAEQLGQALAAVAALAGMIKLNGAIILQLQGSGSMPLLVAQATNNGEIRGLAHFDDQLQAEAAFPELAGKGRIVITIDGKDQERYQGIVEISGNSLAEGLEAYFERSEQLATRIYLAANQQRASALLLQQLADAPEEPQSTDWQHVTAISDTIRAEELLSLDTREILHRLYHEEDVQLFDPQALRFKCSCSLAKAQTAVKGLGQADAEQLVQEQGEIKADCEFCNQRYRFDSVDIAALFKGSQGNPDGLH